KTPFDHFRPADRPGLTDICPRLGGGRTSLVKVAMPLGNSRPAPRVVGIGCGVVSPADGCGMPAEPGRGHVLAAIVISLSITLRNAHQRDDMLSKRTHG